MSKEEKSCLSSSINWYPGHMAKTKREIKENIKLIDVIYELVDARIPSSSKIKDIDDIIKGIPRILVMMKKDLCDFEETKKWISYYESIGYKVVCIDANNNSDYKKLINVTKDIMKDVNDSRKKKGLKEKEIRVAVIGVPNVGKSTLINKLSGKKIAKTGNIPGVTKQINWLNTKKGIILLDTPGILWPKLENNNEALALASLSSIKMEILNMTDIGGYLITFLKNYYPNKLIKRYNIKIGNDPRIIYENLAKKFNFYDELEINYEKVGQKVYNDIVSGAIKGVTLDRWK